MAGLAESLLAPLRRGRALVSRLVQAVLGLRKRWPCWGCPQAALEAAGVSTPEASGAAARAPALLRFAGRNEKGLNDSGRSRLCERGDVDSGAFHEAADPSVKRRPEGKRFGIPGCGHAALPVALVERE